MAGLKLAPIVTAPGEHGSDHPLLAATIGTLPPIGQPFAARARADWLAMITMAFNVVYGPEDAMAQPEGSKPPLAAVPKPARAEHAGYDYYVDAEGFARIDGGTRVNAADVPDAEEIYEYRRGPARSRDTIVWADGSQGLPEGASFTFAGPG
jgi:hypothetical protein